MNETQTEVNSQSSAPSTAQKLWGPEQQPQVETKPEVQAPPSVVEPQPPQQQEVKLTPEALKEMLGEVVERTKPQTQTPEISQEEFNKIFNVVQVDDNILKALGIQTEGARDVLHSLLQRTVQQATTMTAYHMRQELAKLKEQFEPMVGAVREQQMRQMEQEFLVKYPDLKGMELILENIRSRFVAERKMFSSKDEAFKTVAEEARKIKAGIAGLGAQAAKTQPTPNGQMPQLSGGGQGGSGDAKRGQGSGPTGTAKRIFG